MRAVPVDAPACSSRLKHVPLDVHDHRLASVGTLQDISRWSKIASLFLTSGRQLSWQHFGMKPQSVCYMVSHSIRLCHNLIKHSPAHPCTCHISGCEAQESLQRSPSYDGTTSQQPKSKAPTPGHFGGCIHGMPGQPCCPPAGGMAEDVWLKI